MPHWIGLVGLVATVIFCGAFLAHGYPLLALVFLAVGVATILLANKYERKMGQGRPRTQRERL
jgi:membrane protein implicated in regulation of membrane protease activity